MAKRFKVIDLFCGTGGFSHGFNTDDYSYDLVYAIDYVSHAVATTKANHPNARVDFADIRTIDVPNLKSELDTTIDLIVGGPPCQGFTSLRPNRSNGKSDDRNSLFLNFVEFVDVFRPKMFVLENVVGLVTHEHGRTLEIIIEKFSELGYNVEWKILNASHYGVPQKRERFILIGSRDNGPVEFPEPTHYTNAKSIGHKQHHRLQFPSKDLISAVTVDDAISDLPELTRGQTLANYRTSPLNEYQKDRRKNSNILTLHTSANHSDKMMEVMKYAGDSIASIPKGLITSGFSTSYSRIKPNEPANTITVKFQSPASSKCIHPYQNRTITPREAARIQSFDDDYIFEGSLTNIASQLGNAVPPLLGRAISISISKLMDKMS